MKPLILIVGSSNTDMVIKAKHLPAPGETILGGQFFMNPGGKGANQAVAAARLGGDITFICKTGNDLFGRQSVQLFEDEGINVAYMISDQKNPSGVALITIDEQGENCIVVASGSNATLKVDDMIQVKKIISKFSIILMQLEIPLATVEYLASLTFSNNCRVVLNPAPACKLPDELLKSVYIITPNETEAELLSGIKVTDIASAKEAASVIKSKGVHTVIITMGSKGALVFDNGLFTMVEAIYNVPVDSTGAGDVFNGALVVALSEGKSIIESTEFACRAASISVTRLGAQSSAPFRNEIVLAN